MTGQRSSQLNYVPGFATGIPNWWAVQDSLPNNLRIPNKTGEVTVSASVYAGLRFIATLAKVSPS